MKTVAVIPETGGGPMVTLSHKCQTPTALPMGHHTHSRKFILVEPLIQIFRVLVQLRLSLLVLLSAKFVLPIQLTKVSALENFLPSDRR